MQRRLTRFFDRMGKIVRQNVVITYSPPGGALPAAEKALEVPSGGGGPVDLAWANHFAAFGAQSVEQILADYVEESVITVYNQVDQTKTVYEGLSGVNECFADLFQNLSDCSDLAAPVQHCEESSSGCAQVFLIWSCGASGYKTATDTFIFNGSGKILRQNVVAHYEKPKKTRAAKTVKKGCC